MSCEVVLYFLMDYTDAPFSLCYHVIDDVISKSDRESFAVLRCPRPSIISACLCLHLLTN